MALAAAAEIVIAYAETELRRGGKDAAPRALHCLAWLGSGAPEFVPYKCALWCMCFYPYVEQSYGIVP